MFFPSVLYPNYPAGESGIMTFLSMQGLRFTFHIVFLRVLFKKVIQP